MGSTPRLTKVSLSFSSNNNPADATPANTSVGLLTNVPGMLAITSASVPPCLYTFTAPCMMGPRTGTFAPTTVPAPTPDLPAPITGTGVCPPPNTKVPPTLPVTKSNILGITASNFGPCPKVTAWIIKLPKSAVPSTTLPPASSIMFFT